ncbi:DUF1289 domain-containing protein [Saccharobesus litoralis]|uniref:DUF1289 domain-containing protein n=1 Tax=Saccharobesus litoralis TaxID=2172099 RepID=A0A2S0VW51_9ALTE|nr:DUF1289 domain-containing protein [Saccharobesus litoralis]AWB68438.1 DUF1289 domain-containing protein [Saccharobesus litoralis]
MQQAELFEIADVKSPCIGLCQSGPRGYCKGCLRSREERYYWKHLNEKQKIKVLSLCEMRKKKLSSKQAKQQEAELMAEFKQQTQFELF